jgi:hypothetical protein
MPRMYIELSVICKTQNLQALSLITGLRSCGGHNINDTSKKGIMLNYSQWDYETNIVETYYTEDVSKY